LLDAEEQSTKSKKWGRERKERLENSVHWSVGGNHHSYSNWRGSFSQEEGGPNSNDSKKHG